MCCSAHRWFDATVKDVPLRFGSPLPPRDVKPTYAPEKQATAMVRYQWPGLGGMLHVRGDVSYSDSFFYNLRNFDADQFDAYTMVNGGVGWASEDDELAGESRRAQHHQRARRHPGVRPRHALRLQRDRIPAAALRVVEFAELVLSARSQPPGD